MLLHCLVLLFDKIIYALPITLGLGLIGIHFGLGLELERPVRLGAGMCRRDLIGKG